LHDCSSEILPLCRSQHCASSRTASAVQCRAAGSLQRQREKAWQRVTCTYPEPETEKERSSVDFPQVLVYLLGVPCDFKDLIKLQKVCSNIHLLDRSSQTPDMSQKVMLVSSTFVVCQTTGVDDTTAQQAARPHARV
jgi:hypothetical protein